MGPTVIRGLPAHILLVHLVVAIVPIAAVLVIVAGVWPAARRWLNWLPALAALGALIVVPITTHAGNWLKDHLRGQVTPAIQHHADLGNQMLPWVAALFVASLLVWAMARAEGLRTFAVGRTRRGQRLVAKETVAVNASATAATSGEPGATAMPAAGPSHASPSQAGRRGAAISGRAGMAVRVVVAAVAIATAAGAVQQVYRTGEAGSRAVWDGSFSN